MGGVLTKEYKSEWKGGGGEVMDDWMIGSMGSWIVE